MRRLRLAIVLAILALLAGGAGLLFGGTGAQTESDQSYLGRLISSALSTADTRVTIGAVDGALSSDAVLRDLVIADRDGVWLKLDRARLVWNRAALLSRRLQIDKLEIGQLDILRRPASGPPKPPDGSAPALPDLPVKVIVTDFSLARLGLGQPVLGVAASFSARGNALLGNPAEGLTLNFDLARTDAPATFTTKLGYVPKTQALDFTLGLKEEKGGLLAKLARLPGEPPVALDVAGKGTLDAFDAVLAFDAGPGIGATGDAHLAREGTARHLTLATQAQVAGLLPEIGAAIFPGTTRLEADMMLGSDGAIGLPRLSLTTPVARLEAHGDIGANQSLTAALVLDTTPGGAASLKAAGGEIKSFALQASVDGTLGAPAADMTLRLRGVHLPQGALDDLQAHVATQPVAASGGEPAGNAVQVEARASGVVPAGGALAKALGGNLSLSAKGRIRAGGTGTYDSIHIASPHVDFAYSGILGASRVLGRLVAQFPDLAAFDELAGLKLGGTGRIAADLDGAPDAGGLAAALDGAFHNLATGIAPADRLTGGEVAIAGTARSLGAGGFGFEKLQMRGQHAVLAIDGAAMADKADVSASLDIPDLRHADPRLAGKGAATAHLTGSLAKLDGTVRFALANGAMLGRPAPQLALQIDGRDLAGMLDAQAALDGTVDGKPAKGGFHFARETAGWRLDRLDLALGSARVQGGVEIAAGLATGTLGIAARNLDDLSPLLLARLAGEIDAKATLDAADGRQNGRLVLKAAGLKAEGAEVDRIDADVSVADAYGRASLAATANAGRVVFGGETVSQLRLVAKGDANATDIAASAKARGFDLAAKARVTPGETIRIDLGSFEARGQGRRIALAGPARVTLEHGEASIGDLALALDGGRLAVSGRAGKLLDLRIAARAIPLAFADLASPGLGLSGTLDGEAALTGTAVNLAGQWKATIAKLVAPATRAAGLPPMDIAATGRLKGDKTSIDATIAAGKAGTVKIAGTLPLAASGAVDVGAKGKLDLAVANATLAPSGRRAGGNVLIDLRATGRLPRPQLAGTATLAGGSFGDAVQGVQLKDIAARISARGEEIAVEQLSATARNGGTLVATGRLRADAGAGFPGQFHIAGKRAELLANGVATAVADLALDISGPLARNPRLSGTVDLVSLDVAVPDRLAGAAQPLSNVTHINPSKALAARLAAQARAKTLAARKGHAAPPFDASLDVTVNAPNRIFVRGRGIDAELGGTLHATGTLANPRVDGGFDLRRGRLALLGKRLDFTRGAILFRGDLTPELDFLAEARASDVTAQIAITGSAAQPAFSFTSNPFLPQDEVLSRLLFDKAAGSLTGFQALLLAQSAAQLTGSGDNAFERIRRSLGVDGIDIQTGSGGPSAGITRAINDKISVGAKAGVAPAQTGVSVEIDLTRDIRVQGEVTQDGAAAIGIGMQREY